MAEWNRSPDDQNGRLESLFAQLRQQNGSSSSNAPGSSFLNQFASQPTPYLAQSSHQQQIYDQPSASSPLQTPSSYNQHSRHSSAVMSPTAEMPPAQPRPVAPIGSAGPSNADRTASLLNLLKFSQPTNLSGQSNPTAVPPPTSQETPVVLPSPTNRGVLDPLATLMGTGHTKEIKRPTPAVSDDVSSSLNTAASGPSADTQAYLLQLLNRPKASQTDPTAQEAPVVPSTSSVSANPYSGVGELAKSLEDVSLSKSTDIRAESNQPAPKPAQGRFTYVNPFEQLAASSPRNRTPKSSTPAQSSAPAAPAMQILKPQRHNAAESSDLKRKVDRSTPISSPAHSKGKRTSPSSTPSPLPDGRTQIEALMGIGASGKGKETVSEAVSAVGDKVGKEVEEAITRAEADDSQARAEAEEEELRAEAEHAQEVMEKDLENMMNARDETEFELTAKIVALDIKKELAKDGNEHVLEDNYPPSVAEAVQHLVDDAAQGRIADSWESADAEDGPAEPAPESAIKVYNFPLKPFVSLVLHPNREKLPEFRRSAFMDVARLKKDFDQIDRTLVSASNNFIVYAMKNGGFRAIRQIDGRDNKLFANTGENGQSNDRIFNVSLSISHSDATETMIGTGVSGTVYWAAASGPEGELYVGRNDPEKYGFALPPFKAMGEELSGGMVKTRARKSCGHPEFFAVGRGKSIHIIWPSVITKQGYLKKGTERIVDTEKYLNHRSLKINTGKAGKDFTFSQDDTTIVSLDKAGRVKFWDVRTLTNTERGTEARYPTPEQIQPIEINEPLMTLITTPANEKSWPTSVLLIDKLRAYQKGGALRYLIVGMKQNHTLQLWDLALGKQVQELHLPHEKESDAVCSVVYHPSTGMIVVGHPTRNSVYFIHVSAPRYNLQKTISQAEFAERIAAADPMLPKPDATAVMSGIREYSFANKGVLRSLDIVPNPASASSDDNHPSLFELYAMHSKGVTCITIKQQDLGWNKEMKVNNAVDAETEGLITAEPLKPLPSIEVDAPSAPSAGKSVASRAAAKDFTIKDIARKATSSNGQTDHPRIPEASVSTSWGVTNPEVSQTHPVNGAQEPITSGPEKSDKKKKKKSASSARGNSDNRTMPTSNLTDAAMQAPPSVPSPPEVPQDSSFEIISGGKASTEIGSGSAGAGATSLSPASVEAIIRKMEGGVSAEVSRLLTGSLDELYKRFDDDKRTQAAVADAKQDAMLRLISSTLSDNVEKTLAGIVNTTIMSSVLPAISDVTVKSVNDQLGTKLSAHLKSSLPKELQGVLPDVLTKTLQRPDILKLMSDSLAKSVAFRVEEQFSNILKTSITPAFTNLAIKAVQQANGDVQRQAMEVIGKIEQERVADSIKIEQLSNLVTRLTETVSTMAAAQTNFQGEFLKMQQATHARLIENQSSPGSIRSTRPMSQAVMPIPEVDPLEHVINGISSAVNAGDLDTGMMQWIKSEQVQEIFEQYFAKFDPGFVRGVNPLMLLSIGVTISSQLEGNFLGERLNWVETILQALQAISNALEPEVRDLIPKILGSIVSYLEHLFMRVSNISAQDPLLKRLSLMVSTANRIIESSRNTFDPRKPSSSFGTNLVMR